MDETCKPPDNPDGTVNREWLRQECENVLRWSPVATQKRLWIALPAVHYAIRLLDELGQSS